MKWKELEIKQTITMKVDVDAFDKAMVEMGELIEVLRGLEEREGREYIKDVYRVCRHVYEKGKRGFEAGYGKEKEGEKQQIASAVYYHTGEEVW